ncbi:iron ABC transporter substrate-binding protein [Nakamurella endophytica]|uniref:Iron ABC transporter substrate-binding protein n=1 Tax=Nakamurella endophytica TaxID=1748367 RepID=A0A917SV44_9ACTN|nr:iron ABC transporter substrate-binding protein [Nakamurella endophytica]
MTITHKFGTTTVPAAPQRVLSLGYTDHDPLLALGIVPVGVIQWIPEWKRGVGPWAEPLLKGTTPALFGYELDFDKAASLEPDLILNIGFDPDQKTYDRLSAIAPTIAPPAGVKPYGVAWEQMTDLVATAVGRKADGQRLIADTKARVAEAAAAHPGFAGKTFSIAGTYQGQISYYQKTDIRNQLMRSLGFEDTPFVAQQDPEDFFASLSPEQATSLDADLMIFFGEAGTTQASVLKAYPTLATLPVVADGRMLFMTDSKTTMAFSASSVLSIPIALEAVVPAAAKVL